jgi:predicted ribosome-associated RNA-binding protein Tma20
MVLSSSEIKAQNKGIAIKTLHHLNDALWPLKDFKKK